MFGLGPTELILILIIALVIFGPSKIPEIGKSIGKGIGEFKSAAKEVQDSVDEATSDEATSDNEKE